MKSLLKSIYWTLHPKFRQKPIAKATFIKSVQAKMKESRKWIDFDEHRKIVMGK